MNHEGPVETDNANLVVFADLCSVAPGSNVDPAALWRTVGRVAQDLQTGTKFNQSTAQDVLANDGTVV